MGYHLCPMRIEDMIPKISALVNRHRGTLYLGFCLALVGWSAYNLGLLRGHQGGTPLQEATLFRARPPLATTRPMGQGSPPSQPAHTDTRVVVSRASSGKKYHYSWCPGALRIKEVNRLWFPTAQAAQAAGYSLAGNCTE